MAISIVQSAKAAATSVSFGTATTAGNCVLVFFGDTGSISNPSVSAVTLGGAAGNFANLTSLIVSRVYSTAWADPNCAGGQTAVAATETNSSHPVIIAFEVAGLVTASPLDLSATGSGSGASWSSSATGTTAQNNELWAGMVNTGASPTGPASPWVNVTQANSSVNVMAGTDIVSSTGSAVYTGTGGSGNFTALVVTLKGAAGGGGVNSGAFLAMFP